MNWSCPRRVRQCFLTRMTCWASSWLFTQMRDSTETESSTSVLRSGQPIPTSHQRWGNSKFIRVFFIIFVNMQVKCETKVYHPNIDLDGNVCLNILREDWKPVLTINSIVYGLQYLFLVSTLSSRVDKNKMIHDLSYFRNLTLMILWTRRQRWSFKTTGDCLSRMLESLCEVEVSTVYTLRGVTSSEVPPRNETSTGKSEYLLCC